MDLDILPVDDASTAELWRQVHNAIVPADALSPQQVTERMDRYHLTLAYADGVLVGNATVRPAPRPDPATVIVRVVAGHRRRGLGTAYLHRLLADDPELFDRDLASVVLLANPGGLPFARRHGFVEHDRYEIDGAEYADLVRPAAGQRR